MPANKVRGQFARSAARKSSYPQLARLERGGMNAKPLMRKKSETPIQP
jgi:hypothetical protein